MKHTVFVTALRRTEGQNKFLGHAMDEIEHDAARHCGRLTGPYFLTSWIAIYFALHCLGLGSNFVGNANYLTKSEMKTIYGPIHFNDVGRAVRFTAGITEHNMNHKTDAVLLRPKKMKRTLHGPLGSSSISDYYVESFTWEAVCT